MGGFGEERDRVREVSAGGLDQRKTSENQQRNKEPPRADIMCVAVPAAAVPAVPMSAVALGIMAMRDVPMPVSRMRSMARVVVIAVMLVRVPHETRKALI